MTRDNIKQFFFFVFFLFGNIAFVVAQEKDTLKPQDIFDMSLEELLEVKIRVSSTIPLEVFETPSAVTVIDRKTIEQYNFLSVAEAVRCVAGVEILQTVLDRNVPTMRGILQNFYANKVLILIDNIPVWQPTYGNGTLDRIAINDVERIEVLKGPASVLYGANAYNGVINIVLHHQDETKVQAQINGGYPDYGEASVNFTYRKKDFTLQVYGNTLYEERKPYLLKMGADTLKLKDVIYHGLDTINHVFYLHENDTLFYFKENYRNRSFNISANYKGHAFFLNNFTNTFNYPGALATYKSGGNLPFTDKGSLFSYTYQKKVSHKTRLRLNFHYDYFFRKYGWRSHITLI